MSCDIVLELLDAFRTGELTRRKAQVVTRHLAVCESCTRDLAAIQGLAGRAAGMRIAAPGTILAGVQAAPGDGYGEVETELGRVWVGFNARGITMVDLAAKDAASFEETYRRRLGRRVGRRQVPEPYSRALQETASDAPAAVPVDLSNAGSFERDVLLLLRRIPRGEVRPYTWLAREAGRPKAVRAAGNACARNPIPLLLPCHRVVPIQGGVGNYGFGSAFKRDLLRREGVPIDELEDLGRRGIRYFGCTTTHIYCFPTCRDARRMRPGNRMSFSSAKAATEAGYRPCRRCRPDALAS